MTDPSPKALKVFLSYCSEDKLRVRQLYQFLVKAGFDVWMDEKKLLPGQDWDLEIHRALHRAEAVIVVFSENMVSKEGYIQKELRLALDRSQEKPEGTIYLIPTRLEECDVPLRWRHLHYIDLNQRDSGRKLIDSLNARAESLENKKQATAKSQFVLEEFPEPEVVPATQIDTPEPPKEYQESLLAVYSFAPRIVAGFLGLFAAPVIRWILAGSSLSGNSDWISKLIMWIVNIGTVFLAIIAALGAGLLFHYLDRLELDKRKTPLELRYFLAFFIGFPAGVVGVLLFVFGFPVALVALVIGIVFFGNSFPRMSQRK